MGLNADYAAILRGSSRSLPQLRIHLRMDAFAEIMRRGGLDSGSVNYVQNGEIHVGCAPRRAAGNLLRALDCGDNNGDVRFFCGLERAVAELQKLPALAACALRIDGEGTFVIAHQLGDGVNRFERIARVFAVDGQKATFVCTAGKDDLIHILRLGDERKRSVPQCPPRDKRVKIGTMVAYQQELSFRRELFRPNEMDLRAANGEDPVVEQQRGAEVEAVYRLIFLARIYQQRKNQHEQRIQQVCGDEAAERDRDDPPQAECGGQKKDPDCDQNCRDREQIVQHGARPQ